MVHRIGFGNFDLVQVARDVIVDRGPEQAAEITHIMLRRELRLASVQLSCLLLRGGREIRLLWAVVLAVVLSLLGASEQGQAQTEARTYLTFAAEVPFKFTVGQRTFNAGPYKFVVLGPGLLAVLNTKTRVLVRLITRDTQPAEVPANTRLIFTNRKKGYASLTSILLEHRAQALHVVGEEVAIRQSQPQIEPRIPVELFAPQSQSPLSTK